jgi:acetylornithine deacetylase/succinyl-diaminopimelate desuccinylase-like protein
LPIIAMLAALDAIRAAGLELNSNVKFMLDGEEEIGSPNLAEILAANRELFAADIWLVCDGPMHQTRRPLVYFGVRDSVGLDITVYGAKAELHSGHYGGWALNPAMLLARLLTSMKDDNGRVLVEGFYEGIEPLSAMERGALEAAPDIDAELMHELWLGGTEGSPRRLVELITEPTLNVRGLASSRIGDQASNVVPSTATASIDIRIVKGMDGAATQERVVEHIRKQGFFVVDAPPDRETRQQHAPVIWVERRPPGLGAVRTPMDLPISREVIGAVESVLGPAVKLPNMGGTLPLADIESSLGSRTIIVPIANHDNNQHSFDENLRIQNLWDGIELMAAILTL